MILLFDLISCLGLEVSFSRCEISGRTRHLLDIAFKRHLFKTNQASYRHAAEKCLEEQPIVPSLSVQRSPLYRLVG